MTPEQQKQISKRLSLHLRHEPQGLGLTLEPAGWVGVDDLLKAFSQKYFPLTLEQLQTVVANNDKKRFAFDETGQKIRANQGHSVEVDLQLQPQTPPEILYHGTAQHNLEAILREGLKPMSRQHVHLSSDPETARKVGSRHGKPLILKVKAGAMHGAGGVFYRSDNGVWLTEQVAPGWLEPA